MWVERFFGHKGDRIKEIKTLEELRGLKKVLIFNSNGDEWDLVSKQYGKKNMGAYIGSNLASTIDFYKELMLTKGVENVVTFVDPSFCVGNSDENFINKLIKYSKQISPYFVGTGIESCINNDVNGVLRSIAKDRYIGDFYKPRECTLFPPQINEETLSKIFGEILN